MVAGRELSLTKNNDGVQAVETARLDRRLHFFSGTRLYERSVISCSIRSGVVRDS